MASGDVSASSFEFYEGIRILIPGAFAVALFAATGQTFGFQTGSVSSDALTGVVAALAVGLLMYFFDLPQKSAAFRMDLPGTLLERWNQQPRAGTPSNVYFVIFDEKLPRVAFNRALYYGSIFRIGFEAIYLAALTSVIVITIGTLAPTIGVARNPDRATRTILWSTGALQLLILIGAVVARRRWWGVREQRTLRRSPDHSVRPWKRLSEELAYEIPWPDRAGFGIGLAAGAVYLCTDWLAAAVIAISLPACVWALRYFRGYEAPEMIGPREARPPVTPSTALTAIRALNIGGASIGYSITAATALFIAAHRAPEVTPLDRLASAGWALLSVGAGLMIVFRGHERKLAGSYSGQRAWLELNRNTLIEEYFSSAPPDGEHPEPDVPQREATAAGRHKLFLAIAVPFLLAAIRRRRQY